MHPLSLFTHCPRCGGSFAENDSRSKRCAACGFTYYLNASGAYVALIFNADGHLLVTRRGREPAKGTLDLPGGFADPGETAEQGVAREVKEETALTVTRTRYLFSVPNLYEYSGMQIPTLDLFFRCEIADPSVLAPADDASEALWIPPSQLDPSLFGLKSISQGLSRYLRETEQQRRGRAANKAVHPEPFVGHNPFQEFQCAGRDCFRV